MKMTNIQEIKNKDNEVNNEILAYLDLSNPKSFFMLAGAGSGKTRTLVEVLEAIDVKYGNEMSFNGRKIAVITYTNAACNEIISRLKYNELFTVSTIHSFSWEIINTFQKNIKEYIKTELVDDIKELQDKQVKSKKVSSKAYIERVEKLSKKKAKLQSIESIQRFIYSPDGENSSFNSLNHSQVIKMFSEFLKKPLMQDIIIRRFPFILVDECQDTNKRVVESFINLQKENSDKVAIGFFGDMMQRIYSDGKSDLSKALADWNKPVKQMNYRCPKRVVKILNKLREDIDELEQFSDDTKSEGVIRIFICKDNKTNKQEIETLIDESMYEMTGDIGWKTSVETLILEHHMAAGRFGFNDMFSIFSTSKRYKDKMTDGTLVETKFFYDQIFPIINACTENQNYKVAQLAKKYFKQFNGEKINLSIEKISYVKESVDLLKKAFDENDNLTCIEVLKKLNERQDMLLPSSLQLAVDIYIANEANDELSEEAEDYSDDMRILLEVLKLKVSQIENYSKYMNQEAGFSTHQGVKGLEYPRVKLIINDNEARGFMFSYEKLFSIKGKTSTDIKNENEGKDTSIDRTKRLFYVGCSRAEESLAIVLYTDNPESAKNKILDSKWFEKDEIVLMS